VDSNFLLQAVMYLVPLLLSLTVHEWAHAWSAYRLGDDTAARMGRMSLNPIVHIDPIGTLLLPILGVPFGWAKPVPVVPSRFRHDVKMSTGMMITAAAGPISNVVLAVLCAVSLGMMIRFAPSLLQTPGLKELLFILIQMNVALALFNLLPVPPLDGSRVVDGLIPYRMRPQWETFVRFSPIALLLVIFYGGRIIAGPRLWANDVLWSLVKYIAT